MDIGAKPAESLFMPLPTTATLPFAKTPALEMELPHKLIPLRHTQARLRGRQMLVPDIDLAAYRFRALIDWIEFRMRFNRGVQVQQLQPVMVQIFGRNAHNIVEDAGPGGVFTSCRIKVQEPPNLASVAKAHRALVRAAGPADGLIYGATQRFIRYEVQYLALVSIHHINDRECSWLWKALVFRFQ